MVRFSQFISFQEFSYCSKWLKNRKSFWMTKKNPAIVFWKTEETMLIFGMLRECLAVRSQAKAVLLYWRKSNWQILAISLKSILTLKFLVSQPKTQKGGLSCYGCKVAALFLCLFRHFWKYSLHFDRIKWKFELFCLHLSCFFSCSVLILFVYLVVLFIKFHLDIGKLQASKENLDFSGFSLTKLSFCKFPIK